MPGIFDNDYVFDPNAAKVMREGEDVTLVTTGYMLPFVLTAADELAKDGIKADVLHYPSVKPFDAATLVASARKTGGVVTVENQSILGGLGGAVCEILSEQHPVQGQASRHAGQVRRGRHGRLFVREARLRRAAYRRRREIAGNVEIGHANSRESTTRGMGGAVRSCRGRLRLPAKLVRLYGGQDLRRRLA